MLGDDKQNIQYIKQIKKMNEEVRDWQEYWRQFFGDKNSENDIVINFFLFKKKCLIKKYQREINEISSNFSVIKENNNLLLEKVNHFFSWVKINIHCNMQEIDFQVGLYYQMASLCFCIIENNFLDKVEDEFFVSKYLKLAYEFFNEIGKYISVKNLVLLWDDLFKLYFRSEKMDASLSLAIATLFSIEKEYKKDLFIYYEPFLREVTNFNSKQLNLTLQELKNTHSELYDKAWKLIDEQAILKSCFNLTPDQVKLAKSKTLFFSRGSNFIQTQGNRTKNELKFSWP